MEMSSSTVAWFTGSFAVLCAAIVAAVLPGGLGWAITFLIIAVCGFLAGASENRNG